MKLKRGWLLWQDNNPKHTSKSTMDYLKGRTLKVLAWPSQSLDLNIIENLWVALKRAVHARRPKNIIELEAFSKDEWEKIQKKQELKDFFLAPKSVCNLPEGLLISTDYIGCSNFCTYHNDLFLIHLFIYFCSIYDIKYLCIHAYWKYCAQHL